jgi:hypothetical protein
MAPQKTDHVHELTPLKTPSGLSNPALELGPFNWGLLALPEPVGGLPGP